MVDETGDLVGGLGEPDEAAPGAALAVREAPSPSVGVTYQKPLLSDAEINSLWRIAKPLAMSGMFKDVREAEHAFAKMIIGRDLGLTPAQSLQGLYIVDGGIMVAYPMLGQFVRARPGYDYAVVEHDTERCVIEFVVDGVTRGVSTYTIEDAKQAGLVRAGGNWTKAPRNMLFARAMSNGVKWYVPEVLGGIPIYVEGELESSKAVDGATEREALPAPRPSDAFDPSRMAKLIMSLPLSDGWKLRATDAVAGAGWTVAVTEMRLLGLSPDALHAEIEALEWENARPAEAVVSGAETPPPATEAGGESDLPWGDARPGIDALSDDQLGDWTTKILAWLEESEMTEERRNELLSKLDLAEVEIDRRRALALAESGQEPML